MEFPSASGLNKEFPIYISYIYVKYIKKSVFGVISNKNEKARGSTTGEDVDDDIDGIDGEFYNDCGVGTGRVRINSSGEGAIWICNINGNFENGDYITSSVIPGLGQKQNDDLMHNYTVGKITMDCTFLLEAEQTELEQAYECVEFIHNGTTYRKAFVGCTYHCG